MLRHIICFDNIKIKLINYFFFICFYKDSIINGDMAGVSCSPIDLSPDQWIYAVSRPYPLKIIETKTYKKYTLPMKKRILIVDDEPFILSQMSKCLCKICGFHGEIRTVENGEDAIKEIRRCFYDICFLDIGLPDINGLDVMKKINEISPDTRIAIMTGSYVNKYMKTTIDEGASLFLEKPFDFYQIRIFMNKVLGRGGRRSTL